MPPVHASAIVDSRARLASDVVVGPYVGIEGEVRVGPGCVFHAHCIVRGPTTMGMGNVVHPFAVVGGEPQARRSDGSPSRLEVGDGNVFREHTTIHGGTDDRATTIGAHNLFMVGAHVAHDVTIGSYGVFANSVQLAGHVVVEDWATFGG